MATQINMPQLGLTMTEGTVSKWLKQVGDSVEVGDLLVEVSTDKITNQIESSVAGILLAIAVPEGAVVPVKAVLAYIGEAGEAIPQAQAEETVSIESVEESAPLVEVAKPLENGSSSPKGRIKASPLAKKMAKNEKISLEVVTGSGPDGRIVARDISGFKDQLAKQPLTSPLAQKMASAHDVDIVSIAKDGRIMSEDIRGAIESNKVASGVGASLTGMRKVIAERLGQSWRDAPHVHMTAEVDMTEATLLKQRLADRLGEKISFTELIIKACAQTISEYPAFNTSLVNGEIRTSTTINIGVAVAIEQGLVVPVIHDTGSKSLLAIRKEIGQLGGKARGGTLGPDSMTGGTFTVSNLGMYGIDHFTPVINPPESAILGVCRIIEKPVVINGEICIRPMMNLVMSFDHRVIDGALGAQFMKRLREFIEEPILMI